MRKVALPEEFLIDVFGHYDENLKTIEKDLGVRVSARGAEVPGQVEELGDAVRVAAAVAGDQKREAHGRGPGGAVSRSPGRGAPKRAPLRVGAGRANGDGSNSTAVDGGFQLV